MGLVLAREAAPPVQRVVSALLRVRIEIAVAGLDGSGKTAIAHSLIGGAAGAPSATIGVTVLRSRCSGVALTLWDLGGGQRFRAYWVRHAAPCAALLFVIDATDAARLPEARQALHQLLEHQALRGMPLLVLANKTDLLPPAELEQLQRENWAPLVQALNLGRATSGFRWSLLGTSVRRHENLDKVVRWIVLQAHDPGIPAARRTRSKRKLQGGWTAWGRGAAQKPAGTYTLLAADGLGGMHDDDPDSSLGLG
jgi:GTPase SAR1 family protein